MSLPSTGKEWEVICGDGKQPKQTRNSLIVRMFNVVFMCLKLSFLWKYFYFYKWENSIMWKIKPERNEASLIFHYIIKKDGKKFPVRGFFKFLVVSCPGIQDLLH